MIAAKIETTVQNDGELHLTQLPCRKGDRIEAIILVLGDSAVRPIGNGKRPGNDSLSRPKRQPSVRQIPTLLVMNCMNVIDTNIWIYSHDTRDPQKQLVAQNLISTLRPLSLPWQVGCEFIAASRKLASIGFSEANAWSRLADMQSMADEILLPSPQLWQKARSLQERHSLSFWDALLVGICLQEEIQVLYTEDLGSLRDRWLVFGKSLLDSWVQLKSCPPLPYGRGSDGTPSNDSIPTSSKLFTTMSAPAKRSLSAE